MMRISVVLTQPLNTVAGYHCSWDGLNASSHASSNSSDDDLSELVGRTTLGSISHWMSSPLDSFKLKFV
jgi:hypothetical protein